MTAPEATPLICVGRIGGAYGIKGWVRIQSFTDTAEDILALNGWQLAAPGQRDSGKTPTEVEVVEGRMHGKGPIARLAGIEDRNAAERLRGQEIWVAEATLPALEEGEYYWRDLLGLQVYCSGAGAGAGADAGEETGQNDSQEQLLGEVDHLLETGANDVLVLRACDGSVDDRERLIPYLPGEVVMAVDVENRRMSVRWHPED